MIGATLALPFTALKRVLGFAPISASLLLILLAIVVAYGVSAELAKHWFYRSQSRAFLCT